MGRNAIITTGHSSLSRREFIDGLRQDMNKVAIRLETKNVRK